MVVMVLQGTRGYERRLGEAAELGGDASPAERCRWPRERQWWLAGLSIRAKNEHGEGEMDRGEGGVSMCLFHVSWARSWEEGSVNMAKQEVAARAHALALALPTGRG